MVDNVVVKGGGNIGTWIFLLVIVSTLFLFFKSSFLKQFFGFTRLFFYAIFHCIKGAFCPYFLSYYAVILFRWTHSQNQE